MGKLEYGIFHGKAIIDAVKEAFSFDELKENAVYKRDRLSAHDVEIYAKKVAERVVNDEAVTSDYYTCFNIFPDSFTKFIASPSGKWRKKIEKIIVWIIEIEYIQYLFDHNLIPHDCVSFDELKELDDLADADFWDELVGRRFRFKRR